jgi:hypothetical protein
MKCVDGKDENGDACFEITVYDKKKSKNPAPPMDAAVGNLMTVLCVMGCVELPHSGPTPLQ